MIAIIDTGTGNLFNIQKVSGGEITDDIATIENADKIIFPGVGSFPFVIDKIKPFRNTLVKKIRDGTPYLGICLGLEVLFESSEEGKGSGLSIFNGSIKKLTEGRIPHIGWDTVNILKNSKLFSGIKNNTYFYFLHSYYSPVNPYTVSTTEYGNVISSSIEYKNVFGVQFHPEKSGKDGIKILKNFRDGI